MRVAVLGDIHGNAAALRAALKGASREGAEALCVTGDYVGYYYDIVEVLQLLAGWKVFSVRGNHEEMLERSLIDPAFLSECTRRYGSGISVAMEALDATQVQALVHLPPSLRLDLDGLDVLLCHGSPASVDEYIYPDASNATMAPLGDTDAKIVLLGHTHYRMVRKVSDVVVVNPGSVGQPRDRIPGAAWALLETRTGAVSLHAEPYDVSPVAAAARARDPQLPYLHEVLYRT